MKPIKLCATSQSFKHFKILTPAHDLPPTSMEKHLSPNTPLSREYQALPKKKGGEQNVAINNISTDAW